MEAEEKSSAVSVEKIRRLCGEIQLFDLCDLVRCGRRDGRYCTDPDLLARFEEIAEEDDAGPGHTVFVAGEDGDDTPDDDDDLCFGGDESYGEPEEDDDWRD